MFKLTNLFVVQVITCEKYTWGQKQPAQSVTQKSYLPNYADLYDVTNSFFEEHLGEASFRINLF